MNKRTRLIEQVRARNIALLVIPGLVRDLFRVGMEITVIDVDSRTAKGKLHSANDHGVNVLMPDGSVRSAPLLETLELNPNIGLELVGANE